MPRTYKCRKCGKVHGPPTGKHCREIYHEEEAPTEENGGIDIAQVLLRINQRLDDIELRGGAPASDRASESLQDSEGSVNEAANTSNIVATPRATTGRNTAIMNWAAERLEQVRELDEDFETLGDNDRARIRGKKSGCLIVAGDSVAERIDWPHLYVTRAAGGRRKGVAFGDLHMDEFVLGFMSMIESPKCVWDYRTMTKVLRIIMQDSVNISWLFAISLYEAIGREVEKGDMEWGDFERIKEIRFDQSHGAATEKPAERKDTRESGLPPLRAAPPGMRCCAAYQALACEQARDHLPFIHACSYCFKTCAAICRHPEASCIRKVTDASKNVRGREQ